MSQACCRAEASEDKAAARLTPPLKDYWNRVLSPALSSIADDGDLATFLNFQLEHLEVDFERHDGDRDAAEKAELTAEVLEIVKLRIRARIGAAERALGADAQEAA